MSRSKAPEQRALSIDELLVLIEQGNFGLPDFQRPFVWNFERIRRLLATVFMGWPAGLLLLMEAPPQNFFALRALDGATRTVGRDYRHLILDGQQRVTSLAQAFGILPSSQGMQWYLDADLFEEKRHSGDVEDAFLRLDHSSARRDSRLLIPLSALRSASAFQSWRDVAEGGAGLGSHVDHLKVNGIWLNSMSGLREFKLPSTILPSNMPLSSVALIFERLNTAGLSLDTFDLVVAHVYRDGRNLRTVWEAAVRDNPILDAFAGGDALLAAELIAMVTRGDTRRSGLLGLDADVMWELWPRAIRALEHAAIYLSAHAGIFNADQLPHRGILLSLAGAAYELGGFSPGTYDLLRYWVYSRGLSERYNAAVNTRVVSEYREIVHAARGGRITMVPVSVAALRVATRRGNSSIRQTLHAMIRERRPTVYPDGLIALEVQPSFSTSSSFRDGVNSAGVELALASVLSSPGDQRLEAFANVGQWREDLGRLDRGMVDDYLRRQLLPPLESRAWSSMEALIAERAHLVRLAMDELFERCMGTRSPAVRSDTRDAAIRDLVTNAGRLEDPVRSERLLGVAESLLDQGLADSADQLLRLVADSAAPRTPAVELQMLHLQARVLDAVGYPEQALSTFARVLDALEGELPSVGRDTLQAEVLFRMVDLLRAAGRLDDAVRLLERGSRGLGLAPRWNERLAEMMLNYASQLVDEGSRTQAESLADAVLRMGHGGKLDGREGLRLLARAEVLRRQAVAHGFKRN